MWRNHGTKIVGVAVTVLSAVALWPPEVFIELFGAHAPAIATGLGGLLTILRGFQNSGVLPGGPK